MKGNIAAIRDLSDERHWGIPNEHVGKLGIGLPNHAGRKSNLHHVEMAVIPLEKLR